MLAIPGPTWHLYKFNLIVALRCRFAVRCGGVHASRSRSRHFDLPAKVQPNVTPTNESPDAVRAEGGPRFWPAGFFHGKLITYIPFGPCEECSNSERPFCRAPTTTILVIPWLAVDLITLQRARACWTQTHSGARVAASFASTFPSRLWRAGVHHGHHQHEPLAPRRPAHKSIISVAGAHSARRTRVEARIWRWWGVGLPGVVYEQRV